MHKYHQATETHLFNWALYAKYFASRCKKAKQKKVHGNLIRLVKKDQQLTETTSRRDDMYYTYNSHRISKNTLSYNLRVNVKHMTTCYEQ